MKKNRLKGVVVLDLDGVVLDSVKENYVQALKAYTELGKPIKDTKRLQRSFIRSRPLVTRVEHYYTVLRLMQERPNLDVSRMSQKDFDKEFSKDVGHGEKFDKIFKKHRNEMMQKEQKKWYSLTKPFPGMKTFVRVLAKDNHVFASTTKDFNSANELLMFHGIHIPAENIYSKDLHNADKKKHLDDISKKTSTPTTDIVFVEDSLKQLRNTRGLGVNGVLATWGYTTQTQKKEAKKEKIPRMITNLLPRANVRKIKRIQRKTRK